MLAAMCESIRNDPRELLACLAYADWLDESGEAARAHFVRDQCGNEGGRGRVEGLDPLPLADQAKLLHGHESEWLGKWSDLLVRWEWRRGVLDHVTITPAAFIEYGQELFAAHPVRKVTFLSEDGTPIRHREIQRVVACEWFSHVRELDATAAGESDLYDGTGFYLGNDAGASWCRSLGTARHVNKLEALTLSSRHGRSQADLAKPFGLLASAPHMASLRSIALDNHWLLQECTEGDRYIEALAAGAFSPHVESMTLSNTGVTNRGLIALSKAHFPRLRRLDVSEGLNHTSWTSRGTQALLGVFGRARIDDLGVSPLDAVFRGAADLASFRSVRTLRLGYECDSKFQIKPATVAALHASPNVRLQHIIDPPCDSHSAFAGYPLPRPASIGRGRTFPTELWLRGDIRFLPNNGGLLVKLSRQGDVDAIAMWPGFQKVTHLVLHNGYGNRMQLLSLAASPHFPQGLRSVCTIYGSGLTDFELGPLVDVGAFSFLTSFAWNSIWREGPKANEEASRVLRSIRTMPRCTVWLGRATGVNEFLEKCPKREWPRDLILPHNEDTATIQAIRNKLGPRLRLFVSPGY